jgi:hypothetical protein
MHGIRRFRPSPALLLALLAIVVLSAGSATAARLITSSQIKNETIKKADLGKKLKSKVFTTTAFAKVDGNGSLLTGRRATGASRTEAGDFQVTFKSPVDGCAAVATPRGTPGNEFFGYATTYTPPGNAVRVVLHNPVGVKVDGAGFNLGLIC